MAGDLIVVDLIGNSMIVSSLVPGPPGALASPTGTGFIHVTSGTIDAAARAVNLATADVTGVLPYTNGGTGLSTLGSPYAVLQVNSGGTGLQFGTVPLAVVTAPTGSGVAMVASGVWSAAASLGTTKQILVVNAGATAAAWVSLSADVTITAAGAATVNGLQTYAVASTAPSIAGQGLLWSGSAWGPAIVPTSNGVIWRPGGTAGGNVYTTWASAYAAAVLTNGATVIYVDTTDGSATIPSGSYPGYSLLTLAAFNSGNNTCTIADGATLNHWQGVSGLTCVCVAATTSPFIHNDQFILDNHATIQLNAASTVAAFAVANGETLTINCSSGFLSNAAKTTVPVISVANGGTCVLVASSYSAEGQLFTTGNEVGGPSGSTFYLAADDTVTHPTNSLFSGSYTLYKSSYTSLQNSGSATANQVATADGSGNVSWAVPVITAAHGTAAQILVTNSGATASAWVSMSVDATISAAGAVTVASAQAGLISWAATTALETIAATATAPGIIQTTAGSGVTPVGFTITPQAPNAGSGTTASGTPGSLTVALAAPVSTGK